MPWRPVDTRARRANRSTSLQAFGGTGRQPRRATGGVGQQEYYRRADVWPLASQGELLVIIQIEDTAGIPHTAGYARQRAGHRRGSDWRRRSVAGAGF